MSRDEFIKIVDNLKLNETFYLGTDFNFKDVRISYDNNYGFIWSMHSNTHCMSIYPMRDTHHVKHFKTMKNAKRNLIKYCEFCFGCF